MRIGNWNFSPGRVFLGLLDDIRIFNNALTQEEIDQLMTPGTENISNSTLLLNYSFDESEGCTVQ